MATTRVKNNVFEQRCREALALGEEVCLVAEASGWIAPMNAVGPGRAYLTNERFLWIGRRIPLLHRILSWIPDVISIPYEGIERISWNRQWPFRAWLRMRVSGKDYAFRLGRGPFPLLMDNRRTTAAWFEKIQTRLPAK